MRFELLEFFSKKNFVQRPPSGSPKSSHHRLVFVVVVQKYFYYIKLQKWPKNGSHCGQVVVKWGLNCYNFFKKNLCTMTSLGTSKISPCRNLFVVVVVYRYFYVKRFEHDHEMVLVVDEWSLHKWGLNCYNFSKKKPLYKDSLGTSKRSPPRRLVVVVQRVTFIIKALNTTKKWRSSWTSGCYISEVWTVTIFSKKIFVWDLKN